MASTPEPGPAEPSPDAATPSPETGPPAEHPSPSSGRWIVPLVVVAVVLAGIGGYWYLTHGPGTPAGTTGTVPTPPDLVDITSVHFTGQNVNVTPGAVSSLSNLTAGGEVNMTIQLQRHCSTFGCSSQVLVIDVAAPFALLGTYPALPYNWTSSLPASFLLHLQVPSTPGSYAVAGSVTDSAPPGGVTVNGVAFQTTYTGGDSGYLNVTAPAVPLTVAEHSNFSISLQLVSSSWYTEEVASLTLSPPFQLVSTTTTFPLQLYPNETASIPVTVLAPATGNYTMAGNVTTDPSPMITLGNVTWEMTYHVDPFYAVAPVLSHLPSAIHVGQALTMDAWIYNNDTVTHIYQLYAVSGNWTQVSISPTTGKVADQAGSYFEWVITFNAPATVGDYNMLVSFADWS